MRVSIAGWKCLRVPGKAYIGPLKMTKKNRSQCRIWKFGSTSRRVRPDAVVVFCPSVRPVVRPVIVHPLSVRPVASVLLSPSSSPVLPPFSLSVPICLWKISNLHWTKKHIQREVYLAPRAWRNPNIDTNVPIWWITMQLFKTSHEKKGPILPQALFALISI